MESDDAPSVRASRTMRRGSYWRGSSFCHSVASKSGPSSSATRALAVSATSRIARTNAPSFAA
ncbi:hypothetical protein [Herbiconiux sp. UC225_62]|uniref:hypothetical protein n=1 Tax=Herbiconiux sp. UC225_62 TaxID=3350168 RepID=UPI0036D2F7C6